MVGPHGLNIESSVSMGHDRFSAGGVVGAAVPDLNNYCC